MVLDAVDIEAGVAREGLEKVDDSVQAFGRARRSPTGQGKSDRKCFKAHVYF